MNVKLLRSFFCAALFLPAGALAASFPCEKASNTLERTICADSQLSRADEELAQYYGKLKESLNARQSRELLKEQRAWLKQRGEKCPPIDARCLLKFYSDRVLELRARYENLVPYVFDERSSLQGLHGSCALNDVSVGADASIYAAGSYEGRKIDVQIDQSGKQATQFDTIVNSPQKPVVLILGAYSPAIWNIGWTKETKILAVVALGYHRQAVAGLPKGTPLLISTHDNQGPCGYTYVSPRRLDDINPLSIKIFGRPVDKVYLATDGKIVVGNPIAREEPLFTSRDVTPASFVDKNMPLAGAAGIREALAKGLIRPATREDAEAWAIQKAKAAARDPLPPAPGDKAQPRPGPQGNNVFVILKKFRFPAGLYGDNAVKFYLLEGVPYPEGDLGHSDLYDFNTLTCRGLICGGPRSADVGR